MAHRNRSSRWTAIAAAVAALTVPAAIPAAAGPIGPADLQASNAATVGAYYDTNCPLTRLGRQLVRCDNLTGAGVPAPYSVPPR